MKSGPLNNPNQSQSLPFFSNPVQLQPRKKPPTMPNSIVNQKINTSKTHKVRLASGLGSRMLTATGEVPPIVDAWASDSIEQRGGGMWANQWPGPTG
jgi:hypothetical protein